MIRRLLSSVVSCAAVGGVLLGGYAAIARAPSGPPREVAPGVTVSVEPLATDPTGSGRMYLARIKLDPARMDLFITPPDPQLAPAPALPATTRSARLTPDAFAAARDVTVRYTHRLAHTADTARENNLAVAINACLFGGGSRPFRRAGQPAWTIETTVVDGRVVSLWEHTYMLGFRPDLSPEPVLNKPPPLDRLPDWKWAIGAQSWQLFEGRPVWWADDVLNRRTTVGLSADKTELFLAVFESASLARTGRELQARGAAYVFNLDGSESSTLTVNGRALTGDWRPVANHIGIQMK